MEALKLAFDDAYQAYELLTDEDPKVGEAIRLLEGLMQTLRKAMSCATD